MYVIDQSIKLFIIHISLLSTTCINNKKVKNDSAPVHHNKVVYNNHQLVIYQRLIISFWDIWHASTIILNQIKQES